MLRRSMILALTMFSFSVTGLTLQPISAEAQEKVRVTHSTDSFAFLPLFVAVAMDYFKETGLEVEVIRTGSGSKSLAAVIGGDIDVYMGSTASVLQARKQGADVVVFGALVNQFSSSIVVSKEWAASHNVTSSSPMEQKLASLKGIRIGVTGVGSGSDQIVRYLADVAELDPDRDMTIASLGSDGSSMLAALSQNRIDAYSISPPTTQLGIAEFGATMLFNTAVGEVEELDGYFYIGAIANRGWLDANKETATKVAKALQMALDILADPVKTLEAREAVYKMYYPTVDREVYDAVWADQTKSSPKTGHMTRAMFENIIEFSNKFSKEELDASLVDSSYVNDFVDAVAPK